MNDHCLQRQHRTGGDQQGFLHCIHGRRVLDRVPKRSGRPELITLESEHDQCSRFKGHDAASSGDLETEFRQQRLGIL